MSPKSDTLPVRHIAKLANIPITAEEETKLATAFAETLAVVDQLKQVDVTDVEPTSQVTGLENVWREDTLNPADTFSQAQALANAAATHDGYFVVPQVIDQD